MLFDLILPGIGWKDICTCLLNDPQFKSMGTILVTALTTEDHKVAALVFEADDAIDNLYSGREFVARIKRFLDILPCRLTQSMKSWMRTSSFRKPNT